ncbi:uncharacterized protein LOC111100839 [Crassostrea virginica]
MLMPFTVGTLLLCGISLQIAGVDSVSTLCILQCDLSFGAKTQVSGCNCESIKTLLAQRSHLEHTTHPHHLNHHFTDEPTTTTTTPTPLVKTTEDLCNILCAMQQGGDACHCLKPGLPGRK